MCSKDMVAVFGHIVPESNKSDESVKDAMRRNCILVIKNSDLLANKHNVVGSDRRMFEDWTWNSIRMEDVVAQHMARSGWLREAGGSLWGETLRQKGDCMSWGPCFRCSRGEFGDANRHRSRLPINFCILSRQGWSEYISMARWQWTWSSTARVASRELNYRCHPMVWEWMVVISVVVIVVLLMTVYSIDGIRYLLIKS